MDDRSAHHHDHPPAGGGMGGGQECVLCPICVLLQALSTSRPEVMEHLLAAGRELAAAFQALVEAPGEEPDDGHGGLQRVPVE